MGARVQQLTNTEKIQLHMGMMQKDLAKMLDAAQKRSITERKNKTNIVMAEFEVGDFELVPKNSAAQDGHKMLFK